MRPDTVAVFHRQMLEGLDSLVLAMRVLRERETSCSAERTIDCVDARDFGYILGSMRNGARIYLDARRRMRETMRSLGASFPDPPAVSRVRTRPAPSRHERPASVTDPADDVDVVIIGAGVSGLAAAKRLTEAGVTHHGSRGAQSHRRADLHHARRAHATPDRDGRRVRARVGTRARRDRAGVEAGGRRHLGERWRSERGKLTNLDDENYWQQLAHVMERLDPKRTPDRSFQEFLDTKPGGQSLAKQRTLAREYVSGFHAGDPERDERTLARRRRHAR